MKKFLVLLIAIVFAALSSLNSSNAQGTLTGFLPPYGSTPNGPTFCDPQFPCTWSGWAPFNLEGLTNDTLLGPCTFVLNCRYRYCIDNVTQYEFYIDWVFNYPFSEECFNWFLNRYTYVENGDTIANVDELDKLYNVLYKTIFENFVTQFANLPNYDGRFNCPNTFTGTVLSPGNCHKYCIGPAYDVDNWKIGQGSCSDSTGLYCCYKQINYCWDTKLHKALKMNEMNFVGGPVTCDTTVVYTGNCPLDWGYPSKCRNNCAFGQ